jgi:hypothetical protein
VTVEFGGWPNVSIVSYPAASGSFTVPTTPASSTPARVALAPTFTSGPTGLDTYRPWATLLVDGEWFVCNGWDTPRRWDRTLNAWAYMGSAVPTTGAGVLAGAGTAIVNGVTARYYLVGYNSTLDKESAPQEISVVNGAGSTQNVTLTWTASEFAVDQDKVRIYRALDGTGNFKRLGSDTAVATATYTDTQNDAALATALAWDGSSRTTLPSAWLGMALSQKVIFAWLKDSPFLHYSQGIRVSGTYVADDFPAANILSIGADESAGNPTCFISFHGSDVIWTADALYEKTGDDVFTWVVTELSGSRGTFNQRTVAKVNKALYCLDKKGVYKLNTAFNAGVVGTVEELFYAPFQPIYDRMNLAAADDFHSEVLEEEGIVIFWVALDYDPTPSVGIPFNFAKGRFETLITARHPTANGRLLDAQGVRHPMFGCDAGYLWQGLYAASEGVFAGDNTALVTLGTTNLLEASAAAFNTTFANGVLGAPLDRYSSAGAVVDENRVHSATGTTITTRLYPSAAIAAGDTVAIGVIPAVFETAQLSFGTRDIVWVREVWIEYTYGIAGSIRVDTSLDAAAFVYQGEFRLDATQAIDGSGVVRAIVKLTQNRCKQWRLRISQRYANLGFTIQAIHVHWQPIPGKLT